MIDRKRNLSGSPLRVPRARLVRFLVIGASTLLALTAGRGTGAWGAEPGREVVVRRGLLSVDLREAPLAEVLRSIGEQSGLRVTVADEVSAQVTETFTNVPLEQGIRRLARWHSLVAIYVASERAGGVPELAELRVYGMSVRASGEVGAAMDRQDGMDPASLVAAEPGAAAPSVALRIQGLRRLAQTGDQAAVAPLAQALTRDREPQVRAEAAIGLATVGGEAALAALTEALTDENVSVRLRVADALGRFQDDRARQMLDQMGHDDSEPRVRRRATAILEVWRRQGRAPGFAVEDGTRR